MEPSRHRAIVKEMATLLQLMLDEEMYVEPLYELAKSCGVYGLVKLTVFGAGNVELEEEEVEAAWKDFADVPLREDGTIAEDFLDWPAGTDPSEIGKWFANEMAKF